MAGKLRVHYSKSILRCARALFATAFSFLPRQMSAANVESNCRFRYQTAKNLFHFQESSSLSFHYYCIQNIDCEFRKFFIIH